MGVMATRAVMLSDTRVIGQAVLQHIRPTYKVLLEPIAIVFLLAAAEATHTAFRLEVLVAIMLIITCSPIRYSIFGVE